MPNKSKLSPQARLKQVEEEHKGLKIQCEQACKSDEANTSSNGTIVAGYFMKKSDGTMYVKRIEKRSRRHSIQKWEELI